MEKNILIIGPSRAGKTTLSRKINEELNYYAFSMDKIVTSFMRAYPQLEINYTDDKQTAANLAPFLGHFLGTSCGSYDAVKGNRFVMEGYFDFEKVIPIWDRYEIGEFKEHFLIIGLNYPYHTHDRLFNDIRKYETEDDWTCGISDDELKSHVVASIEYSRSFYDEYQKFGSIIYDVSNNREQVLERIINDIKSK